MKAKAIFALLALLLFSSCIYGQGKLQGAKRYVYCNVYLDDVCFGIASGDTVLMTNAVDYVMYRAELSNKKKVDIYYGYNPSADVAGAVGAKNCAIKNGGDCSYNITDGGADFLYRKSPDSHYVHIHVYGDIDASTSEFIRNFRSCKSDDSGISCESGSVFGGLPLTEIKK